ncbi:MAG TPA: hypothetical protein VH500_20650 [Nitrososphaeraceae archaeon]|jgi:hypothetical protein
MDNKNLTIVAISTLASLLAGYMYLSSGIAFACGHHHSNFIRQTDARTNVCGNGIMSSDIDCQNQGNQIDGNHNSDSITDIRPSSSFGGLIMVMMTIMIIMIRLAAQVIAAQVVMSPVVTQS